VTSVVYSDYQRDDAGALAKYVQKDDTQLRDRYGQAMDQRDVDRLVDRSDQHQMSRHFVVSPENAEHLDQEQLGRITRETMRDELGEDVEFGYAVHEDGGDRPHAHVVATGRANQSGDPLWIDSDDLDRIRERVHDRARDLEPERDRPRELVDEQNVGKDLDDMVKRILKEL
jgi:type IV secretory pathway VirD2 relaxase